MIPLPPDPNYDEMIPQLARIEQPIRARVIAGFQQLNRVPFPCPDVSRVVGVVLADNEQGLAVLMERERAAEIGEEQKLGAKLMGILRGSGARDTLDVLVVTPGFEAIVKVPLMFVPMQRAPRGAAD